MTSVWLKKKYPLLHFVGMMAVLFLMGTANKSMAANLSVVLSSDMDYSSNIDSDTTNTVEDVVQSIGIKVGVIENTKNYQVSGDFSVKGEHSYADRFSDQSAASAGFGLFNFDLIESFLNWQSSVTRNQVLNDVTGTDTDDNTGHRDIIRTGPGVSYKISKSTSLGLVANYINVEISDPTGVDTERVDANLNLKHEVNSVTALTLTTQYEELLKAAETDEFQSSNINVGLIRRFPRGSLVFKYGETKSESNNISATKGSFYNLTLIKEKVLWHDLSLRYVQDISDVSLGFDLDLELPAGEVATVNVTGNDIVKRKSFNFGISRVFGLYNYRVGVSFDESDFVTRNDDSKSKGLNVSFGQNISRGLDVTYSYAFGSSEFAEQPDVGTSSTTRYKVRSTYSLSADLSVNGFVGFAKRKNNENQIKEFEAFSMGVGVAWAIY